MMYTFSDVDFDLLDDSWDECAQRSRFQTIPVLGESGHGNGRVIRSPRVLFEETDDGMGDLDE